MSTSKGPPNRLFSSFTNITGPSQRLSTVNIQISLYYGLINIIKQIFQLK